MSGATRPLLFGCVTALVTTPMLASTRVAVYAIVDRIDFEPSSFEPDRAWIEGVFVLPTPVSSGEHAVPERGHLYFSVNPGDPDATRRDWEALRAAAGTSKVVGFGQYWMSCSRRALPAAAGDSNCSFETTVQADRTRATPDPYPIPSDEGVVSVFDHADDVCPRFGRPSVQIVAELREAHLPNGFHEVPPACPDLIGLVASSELDSVFVEQARNAEWADASEALILTRLAGAPSLKLSELRVECRDTICRIHAAFPTLDYRESTGNRLVADALKDLPGFAPGGKGIVPHETPTLTYYFQRRSPL